MRIFFPGTRGEIEARSRRHHRHSALLAASRSGARAVMIDCGVDWFGRLAAIRPAAILLTHAHRDHAGGLKRGADCPVYGTAETWSVLKRYAVADRRVIEAGLPFTVAGLQFQAWPVEHSIRAPAVGFRITHRDRSIFYAPDLVAIRDQFRALAGIRLYIGDGASVVRPLIRKRGDVSIGHAPIAAQLRWCREGGVPRAIFTHCGSQIVAGDERSAAAKIRWLGAEAGVEAALAYDGLALRV